MEKEVGGKVEKAVVCPVLTDGENRARFLYEAVKGAGTDEKAMIDVLCTATPSQIRATKEAFNRMYIIKFDTRVKLESAGNLQQIFEAVLNPKRPESGVQQEHMAQDIENFAKVKIGVSVFLLFFLIQKTN